MAAPAEGRLFHVQSGERRPCRAPLVERRQQSAVVPTRHATTYNLHAGNAILVTIAFCGEHADKLYRAPQRALRRRAVLRGLV
eukprot:4662577-Prymnesium_polylepis.2